VKVVGRKTRRRFHTANSGVKGNRFLGVRHEKRTGYACMHVKHGLVVAWELPWCDDNLLSVEETQARRSCAKCGE
jgi:hypothetical protein